jgi:hypothetical protein
VQFAKLRFFISLICDQAHRPAEDKLRHPAAAEPRNQGRGGQIALGLHRGQLLPAPTRSSAGKDLQKVRHDNYSARSYKRKKELRK